MQLPRSTPQTAASTIITVPLLSPFSSGKLSVPVCPPEPAGDVSPPEPAGDVSPPEPARDVSPPDGSVVAGSDVESGADVA